MTKIHRYEQFLESKEEKDMWDIIPKEVKKLHKLFKQNGKKIWVVGGAVRDFLNGDTPKDFDVATNSLPEETLKFLKISNEFNVPADGLVGQRFGVIIVKHKDYGDSMEIASLRKDLTKGRNPKIKLGVSLEEDLQRRDITINAMAYDMDTKEIIDLVGGEEDLKNKIIRMVGTAMDRIEEDPLRILRAFRFAARYGAPFTDDIIDAIKTNKKLESIIDGELKRVSAEAIWTEFTKAWSQAQDFTKYLTFITEFEMWDEMFPGAKINEDFKRTTDFYVMFADLMKDSGISSKQIVKRLKIDGRTVAVADFLYDLPKLSEKNVLRLNGVKNRLNITDETIREWLRINNLEDKIYYAFIRFEPTITGKQLIQDEGFKPGPELGQELAKRNIDLFKSML